VDVSEEFLAVLDSPAHGYGKNFNPCVDCKIFLIRKALEVMREEGAGFLITGEVLGQRPMSQRRDALSAIARETGTRGLLLRPLSARCLPPTAPEERGWVDRRALYGFSGRNRRPQLELAEALGVRDFPTPAGGCRLTDPCLAARVRRYFERVPKPERAASDVRLLLLGRPFRLPGGSLFTLGRDEAENAALAGLAQPGDELAAVPGVPGPLGLLRPRGEPERALAAAALLRYCKRAGPGARVGFGPDPERPERELAAEAATDEALDAWRA
jgi:hypothetical protein